MLKIWKWSLLGVMGRFTTSFSASKVAYVFLISYVRLRLISRTNSCADRSIPVLLTAYQEYLLTPKLMASQVVQSEWPQSRRKRPLPAGRSVLRKLPEVQPYWGVKTEGTIFPIRTDQGHQIKLLLWLKQSFCWILIKAVQFNSDVRVRLTFRAQTAILFALCWKLTFYVVLRCNKQLKKLPNL